MSHYASLHYHLQFNHFPPVGVEFIPIAELAIERANDELWGDVIDLPNGHALTVEDIVESLHLDFFIDQWEDDDVG